MERRSAEPTFVDAAMEDLGGRRTRELLRKLELAVPWEELARLVRPLYRNDAVKGGRPPIPAIQMLKCLMLCKWFNLSDPGMEEQVNDRISFKRFVGLRAKEAAPDETTMVSFRDRLREAGLFEQLFEQMNAHLSDRGLLVREGTIVDATIIEQSRGRTREDGTSTRDAQASYTKKSGQIYHGFKLHTAVDAPSGLIADLRFTTAKVHDSTQFEELTKHETVAAIADSAYADRLRRRRLQQRGVMDGILYKRVRGQARLHPWQERFNKVVAKLRGPGELPFAWLKRFQGFRHVRYRGLQRNREDAWCHALAFNCRRMLCLIR